MAVDLGLLLRTLRFAAAPPIQPGPPTRNVGRGARLQVQGKGLPHCSGGVRNGRRWRAARHAREDAMDFTNLLLVLLALPVAAAGVILAVSFARRRARTPAGDSATQPVHRLQTGTAAAQDAAVHPAAAPPKATSARKLRGASAPRHK